MTADTLVADTACIGAWTSSGSYAYKEQLMMPERDLTEEWLEWLSRHFSEWDMHFSQWTPTKVAEVIVAVVAVCVGLYLLWHNRYRWVGTRRTGRVTVDYDVTDDNIYGIDFDRSIKASFEKQLYGETVRLCYLRFLRTLADRGIIVWQTGRTPQTYLASVPPGDDRRTLSRLTNLYVQLRYGHYPATRERAETALTLSNPKQSPNTTDE